MREALDDAASYVGAGGEELSRVIAGLALAGLLDADPSALNNADARRVSLAIEALGQPSSLLLADATLGLSGGERERFVLDIRRFFAELPMTVLLSTGDADEALRVAQRVAYIEDGKVLQVGTPAQLLENPATLNIARYLAGDRLPSTPARVAAAHVQLPGGAIARPLHVPPPRTPGRPVVYAAWPRSEEVTRRRPGKHKERAAAPGRLSVPVGGAAEPALVFDPDTGTRLDRGRGAPTRSINVFVANGGGRRMITQSLRVSDRYQLVVWIGAHDPQSIVVNAAEDSFPDALLPPTAAGHLLTVVAHSGELKLGRAMHTLRLPAYGDSRRISIGFRTPQKEGSGTVRLAFYYRRHSLQSLLVELAWGVVSDAHPAARIDYSVSDFVDVAALPDRDLNLGVNETTGRQHRVLVNGRDGSGFGVTLYERQMADRLTAARQALLATHRDPETDESRYDAENAKSRDDFIADLT